MIAIIPFGDDIDDLIHETVKADHRGRFECRRERGQRGGSLGAELGVISTSLFRFKGPFGAHWENISAGAVLVILPTLVVLLFLQRYIHNGFTQGGESCYRFSSHS